MGSGEKARELDLAAAQDFQRLYGEFSAVWKIWAAVNEGAHSAERPDGVAWALLERASVMEGGIEALLTKVCAERILSGFDIDALGSLRQALVVGDAVLGEHLAVALQSFKAAGRVLRGR